MRKARGIGLVLLVIVALLALGCASRQGLAAPTAAPVAVEREMVLSGKAAPAADASGMPQWSGENGAADIEAIDPKIIYDVSMHLVVEDTDEAFAEVQRLTQATGGFVADSNVWRDGEHHRASITVRVPVGQMEDALSQFRALALDVESENIDSRDVTADYVDLEARLVNEQRTEAELQELLETRSEIGKTEDILEVHRELSRVRAEVESIQGRMRYLENLSALATVRIQLTPDELMQPIDVAGWRPQGTVRNTIRMLLRTMQFFVDVVIFVGLYILPTLIVIAIPVTILVLLIRWLVRRARRTKRARVEQA